MTQRWEDLFGQFMKLTEENRRSAEPLAGELIEKFEREVKPLVEGFVGMLGGSGSGEAAQSSQPSSKAEPKAEKAAKPDPLHDLFRADRTPPEPAPAESTDPEAVMGLRMLRMEAAALLGADESTEDMMLALRLRELRQKRNREQG